MDIVYGTSSFDRNRGNFPEVPVINMFAEETPTEPKVALQSRPGMENTGVTMGSGPVKALMQIDGVLNDGLFGVSGTHLYSSATDLGAIDGTGPVSMAGYTDRIFVNAGQSLWVYNGTTLTTIATPGSFDVLHLCVGTSRLIVIDKGTGQFFWSDPLTSTVGALNFATAENSPDNLKACLFLGDTLILFGSETVEFWPASASNPDLPYQPLVGRTFQVGIRDTDAATLFKSSFAWITNRNQVCVTDVNTIISNSSLEEKINASTVARLWTFRLEGVDFLALTLDDDTWVFSSRTSQWSQFRSYGQTNWIPRCATGNNLGSSIDGRVVKFSADHQDFGGVLERRFRAGMPVTTGTVPLDNVIMRTNPGQTPFLTGDYVDPVVEMRVSKDGGYRWGNWRQKPLGQSGEYKKSFAWRSLGRCGFPGPLLEFRVTAPVPFRVSDLVVNEGLETIGSTTS
jgi:hypothetical protein